MEPAKIDSSKLIEHLKVKWKNDLCPMCGSDNWGVSARVFEIREFVVEPTSGTHLINSIPITPVVCNNCGNMLLINTIAAELTSQIHDKQ